MESKTNIIKDCIQIGTIIIAGIVYYLSHNKKTVKKSRKRKIFMSKLILSLNFSKFNEINFSSMNKHASAIFIGMTEKEDKITKINKLSNENINDQKDRIFFKMLKNMTGLYCAEKNFKESNKLSLPKVE